MLRIRRLDLFIVKSFLWLFAGTFFICLFIFMMQFLWKYVDDLVGKGLEMTVVVQFFFYAALTLIPLSLPLAVLLASLITFGNFGERFELLAMKAAGISLYKIMRPLVVILCFVCLTSFYFQNVIGPMAQQKLGTLIISMRQKSPELDIPEGVFYSEIPNYNLRVGHKNRETGMLYDVLIYNFQDGVDNAHIIYADSGKLEMTADKQHLFLRLFDGELFENLKEQNMKSKNVPYRRESFRKKESIIEFDSEFNMADASIMSNQATTKSMQSLRASIDSMSVESDSLGRAYYASLDNAFNPPSHHLTREDTVKVRVADRRLYNVDSLYTSAQLNDKQKIISAAEAKVESLSGDLNFKSYSMESTDYQIRRHWVEWNRKITFSLSCMLFFFIGAPLGGIIRKGGLGMPVVVSVLFFIVYYIIDNTGFKMSRDGNLDVYFGTWLSSIVLAPLGLFLTYKSNNDSVVFKFDSYAGFVKRIFGIRPVRHYARKEVILFDPDYTQVQQELDGISDDCRRYLAEQRLTKAPNYYRMWTHGNGHDPLVDIYDRLEMLIENLTNSKSVAIISSLCIYPVIPLKAHIRPFDYRWINVLVGILFPIGLFFYFRIWMFRIRLKKDLELIIKNNQDIKTLIERENNLKY